MRIVHTADWHLCSRLGKHDRSAELLDRVRRVAAYCEEHAADVLAVAGDLFDTFDVRPEEMADALNDVNKAFRPFFARGGTVLAVTGNHDSDSRIDLVKAGMSLVTTPTAPGGELAPGRMYLWNRCFYGTLRAAAGDRVQFVLVPYPFAHRYDLPPGFRTREELNTQLRARVAEWVQAVPGKLGFDVTLPTVLVAHLHVTGAELRGRYKMTPREDVLIEPGFLGDWAYAALGHVHQRQHLPGLPAVRYSGPLDRLDFGERDDDRGVWLVDVGPTGLRGEPAWLPLEPTPLLDLAVSCAEDLAAATAHPQRETAFARVTVGPCGLPRDDVARALRAAFPRLHEVRWPGETPAAAAGGHAPGERVGGTADVAGAVRRYLEGELAADHPDRQALLDLADQFLAQEATP